MRRVVAPMGTTCICDGVVGATSMNGDETVLVEYVPVQGIDALLLSLVRNVGLLTLMTSIICAIVITCLCVWYAVARRDRCSRRETVVRATSPGVPPIREQSPRPKVVRKAIGKKGTRVTRSGAIPKQQTPESVLMIDEKQGDSKPKAEGFLCLLRKLSNVE